MRLVRDTRSTTNAGRPLGHGRRTLEEIMTLTRLLVALALVAGLAVAAEAAVTVRTAPAEPLGGGTAHCAVTNGGTANGTATLSLFSFSDNGPIATDAGIVVGPNRTVTGSAVSTSATDPSWCECSIPNKNDFRCSFIVVNGENVTVVPAR